jgi:hypothetical protein
MEVLRNLKETEKVWTAIKAESEQTLDQLKNNIAKLHKVSSEESSGERAKQIDIQVNVKGTKIAAIVDSGADVDYVNETWCRQMGYNITEEGECFMRSYDGVEKRAKILKTWIEFRYQGQRIRQRFQVVKETDGDLMVLGLPWLQRLNPDVDWKKRTVTLKKTSTDTRRNETPASKEADEAKNKTSQDKKKPTKFGKRGGYGGDQVMRTKKQAEEEMKRYAKQVAR